MEVNASHRGGIRSNLQREVMNAMSGSRLSHMVHSPPSDKDIVDPVYVLEGSVPGSRWEVMLPSSSDPRMGLGTASPASVAVKLGDPALTCYRAAAFLYVCMCVRGEPWQQDLLQDRAGPPCAVHGFLLVGEVWRFVSCGWLPNSVANKLAPSALL